MFCFFSEWLSECFFNLTMALIKLATYAEGQFSMEMYNLMKQPIDTRLVTLLTVVYNQLYMPADVMNASKTL